MEDQIFLKHKGKFYGHFHYCHIFGHIAINCRTKRKDLSRESEKQRTSVSNVPHGNMWRIKEDSKDIEEINISNINEVSKDDDEHNSSIDKNDIHYEEKQDGDVKEYTDEDEDEEGYSDCGILF